MKLKSVVLLVLAVLLTIVFVGCSAKEIVPVEENAEITEFKKLISVGNQIKDKWIELKAELDENVAKDSLIAWLKRQDGVESAEFNEENIIKITDKYGHSLFHVPRWDESDSDMNFNRMNLDNTLGCTILYNEETDKKAIVFSPYHGELGDTYQSTMVTRLLDAGFQIDGDAFETDPISLGTLNSLDQYDFIHINTHGGYSNWNDEDTDNEIAVSLHLDFNSLPVNEQQDILDEGALCVSTKGVGFTDDYIVEQFSEHDFDDAFIGIDACHSFETDIMANAFINYGASVYWGWKGLDRSSFDSDVWDTMLSELLDGRPASDAYLLAREGYYPKHWTDNCAFIIWFCENHYTYFEMKAKDGGPFYLVGPYPDPVVTITSPSDGSSSTERSITVSGSITNFTGTIATMTINGHDQTIPVTQSDGIFSNVAVIISGNNTIRVSATEGGETGFDEIIVTGNFPPAEIWVQLTWDADLADVDLYVTEPDGGTSWFSDMITSNGGELDVDDVNGYGPEHYYISEAEGDTPPSGDYEVRVHYYENHGWIEGIPVTIVIYRNEVFFGEYTHTLTALSDNSSAASPGGWDDDPNSWWEVIYVPLVLGRPVPERNPIRFSPNPIAKKTGSYRTLWK